MFTPNCEIILSGLPMTNEDEVSIRHMMQKLQNLSPSDGNISLHLVKNQNSTSGLLSVNSHDLNLKLNHEGIDPVTVVKQLSSDLQFQLKDWVKERVFL